MKEIEHVHPSSLDLATLRACATGLPGEFLKGVGYSREEIQELLRLYEHPTRSITCFISYARTDNDFCQHLHDFLEARGIQCWKDTDDLQAGDYWRRQIADAIRLHDKVLLICSAESLLRDNVVDEILAAIRQERVVGKRKLVPISLDHFVYEHDVAERIAQKLPDPMLREEWTSYIREYHIPDFSKWRDSAWFEHACNKLARELTHSD